MMLHEAEALRDRLKADLRAVERFLEVARRNEFVIDTFGFSTESDIELAPAPAVAAAPVQGPQSSNGATIRSYGEIGRAVEHAIKQCSERFNAREVERILRQRGSNISRPVIARTLRRFEEQKKIRVVRKGSGRRATRYTNVSL